MRVFNKSLFSKNKTFCGSESLTCLNHGLSPSLLSPSSLHSLVWPSLLALLLPHVCSCAHPRQPWHARAQGHPTTLVNPLLVFNTVFGLTVEDLSEGGGPFLGVDDCKFLVDVYVGDTLTARSTVVAARDSKGQPAFGIVTWHTEGFNQHGEKVVDYHRTNLVRKRKRG